MMLDEHASSALVLHVLTDHQRSRGRTMLAVAREAIEGGASVIQLRDKTASTRTLIDEGQALRVLTRERGVLLIVNDRLDVALACDADGLHVGQDDMPVGLARRLLGSERILGVSAGNLEEAEEAVTGGADYLGIGPIYSTLTKQDAGPATGVDLLRQLVARYPTPLVAIGGITTENVAEIIYAGATGVAVITAVANAENIVLAARELHNALASRDKTR